MSLDTIIEKLTSGKAVFNIDSNTINLGEKANLTLFNPEGNWVFEKENIQSKSKNSAFLGTKMSGKAYGIINQGKMVLNQ